MLVRIEFFAEVRLRGARRNALRAHDARPQRPGYGSAEMLGWPVDKRGIEPHVKEFDKSERTDGTFSRRTFDYDARADVG